MLARVQDQQQTPVAQGLGHRVGQRLPRFLDHPHRLGDPGVDLQPRPDVGEIGEPHPVREGHGGLFGHAQGQPRLADAVDTADVHRAAGTEQVEQIAQIRFPANEAGARPGEVVPRRRGQRCHGLHM